MIAARTGPGHHDRGQDGASGGMIMARTGLRRRDAPNQGVQEEIDLFGRAERVGFYNTFAAWSDADRAEVRSM